MIELSDAEGALLVEILRAGSMRWDVYNEKCSSNKLEPSRLLLTLEMLEFLELHFEGGEHEGRGSMADREIADNALVTLTQRGRKIAEPVGRVRAVFCDDSPSAVVPTSAGSKTRIRARRRPSQHNMFP